MKAYYDQDADLSVLSGKTVAILGYGSQGHAHAQNLRDSGVNVIVAQRPGGANYALAKEHGFEPVSVAEAAEKADLIMILLPDEHQAAVYEKDIKPHLCAGQVSALCSRFQYPLRPDRTSEGCGRLHDCPQGAGSSGSSHLC